MGIRVKGQCMIAFERALSDLKGAAAMNPVLERVPADVANAIRSREILAVGWYPMEWFASCHDAAQGVFGSSISREIGRSATHHDVTKLYRFILRFLSPGTLIKQSGRVLGLICDSGAVYIEENRKGFARLRYSGCGGSTRGVWEDFLGSTEIMLELCGGVGATGRILEGGHGDSMVCSYTWSER